MTRIMYDSVTRGAIPEDATAVAGYLDGYNNFNYLVRTYPHANHLSISVTGVPIAACGDYESEAMKYDDAGAYTERQIAHYPKGFKPVEYASRDNMSLVLASVERAGYTRNQVRVWSAHYGAGRHICGPHTCGAPFQADATQWTDAALGRNLDESILADGFFPAKKVSHASAIHPKVTAAAIGGAAMTAVEAVLHAHGFVGWKPTPAESAAIATAAATLAGYLR